MDDEIDLRQYAHVLWKRRYSIAAVALVALLVALVLSMVLPSIYESEATIATSESSDPIYSAPASAARFLTSLTVLNEAAKAIGLLEPAYQLRRVVRVEPVRDTRMIRLVVRYTNPDQAQKLAEELGRIYVQRASIRILQRRALTKARLDDLSAQLADIQRILQQSRALLARLLEGKYPLSREDRDLIRTFTLNANSLSENLYKDLKTSQRDLSGELLTLDPPVVVDPPSLSPGPVAPRRVLNITIALVLGLVIGSLVAFVREFVTAAAPASAGLAIPSAVEHK